MNEYEGYRKIKGSDLPLEQQDALRRALRHDLAQALIDSVRSVPPEVDLNSINVVLAGAAGIVNSSVAECVTCVTCVTCGTCGTS